MNYVDSAVQELGLSRRVVLQTQSYLDTPRTLAETDHVLTVTRSIAARFEVQILNLPFAVPPLVISLYWDAASAADPGSTWMRNLLLRHFQVSDEGVPPTGD